MKKKVAIIGYGGMGSFHAMNITGGSGAYMVRGELPPSDVVELAGVYDIDPEACQRAKDRGLFVYDSLEALLSDPQVEIVTIAIPNDGHKEMAVKAMAAGKNVICEKPVTLNSALLQEMFDASKKYGKLFTVHQNRRWDNDYRAIRQVYDSGVLGDVFNIETRVHGSRGIPGDWRAQPEHGGGMVLDWGVHLLDQILWMFPEKITSLYCRLDHVTTELVDDGFKLEMKFENGVNVHVEVGTSNFVNLPRWYMQGRNGTAIINSFKGDGEIVCCDNWDGKDAVPVVTAAGVTKTMAPRTKDTITTHELPQPKMDVHDFYRNVCKAIDGEEEQIVTHAQVMRVMKVMEAAFESDRTDSVIRFNG